ncbi:YggS family pyridoxal phosphate-dependent enzyme [soil metagenome]
MLTSHHTIAENLALVRSRIHAAAQRVGRDPSTVTLIAVSKTFSPGHVRAAWDAGQRDFGENKVQETEGKTSAITDLPVRWHLIGHLQSNKARKAAGIFSTIHTVDSLDLLERLDAAAAAQGTTPDVLIQADFAGEATKHGAPEGQVEAIARSALEATAVRLRGLMLMPPWNENQEETRPWFARLRTLRDRLVSQGMPAASLEHLSMGMSHDFEAAVEEGATMVRVGTAIFGTRARP